MPKFSRQELREMSTFNSEVTFAKKTDPTRPNVEHFISQNFYESYGAIVNYFSQVLVFCNNQDNRLIAAFGITHLANRRAYLESYLSNPIEKEIAAFTGKSVKRREIFELGNLAAIYPGATRKLIQRMAFDLYGFGARWVVFTANTLVINAFQRLGLNPISLKEANPNLLPDRGSNWGSYYEDKPQVMFIEVPQPEHNF
jgi:Thermostable hemolysin